MIAFPMGLPAYDTVRVLIEAVSFEDVQSSLDPDSARLWWAGKVSRRGPKQMVERVIREWLGSLCFFPCCSLLLSASLSFPCHCCRLLPPLDLVPLCCYLLF